MIVLAVVAVIIFLLLVLPIRIYVRYDGVRNEVWGKAGLFKFGIYPRPKKHGSGKSASSKPASGKSASSDAHKEGGQSQPFEAAKPEEIKDETKEQIKEQIKEEIKPKEKTENKKTSADEKSAESGEKPFGAGEEEKPSGRIEQLSGYLKKAKEFLGPLRKALRMLIKAEKLEATVAIGAEEADKTAIYAGMLWGIGYSLIALINEVIKVENHSCNVIPRYDRPIIEAEAFCIFRSNLANIIGAAAIIGIAYLKYKLSLKPSPLRRRASF